MDRIENIHPGEVLLEEFLEPLVISQNKLAKAMHVSPRRINEIVHGKRSITADTAIRLSLALGTTPQFWTNLQAAYELEAAGLSNSSEFKAIERIPAA
jgi:addiction module HigA family antidote